MDPNGETGCAALLFESLATVFCSAALFALVSMLKAEAKEGESCAALLFDLAVKHCCLVVLFASVTILVFERKGRESCSVLSFASDKIADDDGRIGAHLLARYAMLLQVHAVHTENLWCSVAMQVMIFAITWLADHEKARASDCIERSAMK